MASGPWLERGGMVMSIFEKEMEKLKKKEGLDNLSVFFADYETFEEIPLFSRWKNISFLSKLTFNEKNKVLLESSLKMVDFCQKEAVKYLREDELDDYFICTTLTGWDDYDEINCLNANFFISRKKDWLLTHLNLSKNNSIEENLISEYLLSFSRLDFDVVCSNEFEHNKRVFVVNRLPV
ncbi:Imm15 family immunity protein [Pantoea sp. App145]|uniref:Imm15 family immunity protein n=1 Tax=Pantoea sp. App145 TaxID=3071567 RepID=UPI003A7FF841